MISRPPHWLPAPPTIGRAAGPPSPADLVELLARSAHATRASLDHCCTVTTVIIERAMPDGAPQGVVVEVLHQPDSGRGRQWMVMALDALTDRQIGPFYGANVQDAISALTWNDLDQVSDPPGTRRGRPQSRIMDPDR